jgi:hypothetical protein
MTTLPQLPTRFPSPPIYSKGGDCRIGLVISDTPRLGGTGAAILQKECEPSSSITENLL